MQSCLKLFYGGSQILCFCAQPVCVLKHAMIYYESVLQPLKLCWISMTPSAITYIIITSISGAVVCNSGVNCDG